MKKKNIGINALLNVLKSALSVLFPLITYPYALRILGADGIGKVSYGASIISYFSMLAMLGVSTYGVREGAKKKNNDEEFKVFVNEVFTINVISTLASYVLLFIVILTLDGLHDYQKLLTLQSVSIILTTLGLEWINTLYEDFLLITIRSIATHLLTLILLFLFVKTPQDYYVYALFTVLANGIVCISNWFYVRRYLKVSLTLHPNIKKHIRPLLYLFSSAVAISIYVNFDTTMLGWMKGDAMVGYYAVAVKIYSIIKGMIAAAYVVSISRLSSYIGEKNLSHYKQLYTKVCNYLTIILIPLEIGLICISNEIMMFMGGSSYTVATTTLQILSGALIFSIYGGLVTAVLNVTIGGEKDNLIATLISAIINCLLNFIFIPLLSQNGAAITTLISEGFVFAFCFIRIRNKTNYLDYNSFRKFFRDAILGSISIVLVTLVVKNVVSIWYLRLSIIIIASIMSYVIVLIVLKNPMVNEIEKTVKSKLSKHEKNLD